jgi:hypothetical protein
MHQQSQSIAQAWQQFSKTKVAEGRGKYQQKLEEKGLGTQSKVLK